MEENEVQKARSTFMMRVCTLHSANGAGCVAELTELRLQCIYSSMAELMNNAALCISLAKRQCAKQYQLLLMLKVLWPSWLKLSSSWGHINATSS